MARFFMPGAPLIAVFDEWEAFSSIIPRHAAGPHPAVEIPTGRQHANG